MSAIAALEKPVVTEEMKRQYHEEGYMILPAVLDQTTLEMLREECHYFVGYMDGKMDAEGQTTHEITHRGKRYFIGNIHQLSHRLYQYIYSDLMADICKTALGDDAYLFNEQWVVKGAEQGMKFAWHQDSGYVKYADKKTYYPKPYLTVWTTLDDVDESNGTVYILPHDVAGTKETIFDHEKEDGTNDRVGYTGDEEGIPVIAPAGSVVAFSSFTFHRSGANTTPRMRRVFLTQYSSEVIIDQTTGKPWAQDVPFIKDGENIYDHAADWAKRGL